MSPGPFKYDAFLSHSSKDKPWVRALAERLTSRGLRVWIDEDDLPWGEPTRRGLDRAVAQSRHVVLVMTPQSNTSAWVELETLLASRPDPSNRSRAVLPLLLEPCEAPAHLAILNYLDVSTPSRLEHQFERIVADLLAGREAAEPGREGGDSTAPAGRDADRRL